MLNQRDSEILIDFLKNVDNSNKEFEIRFGRFGYKTFDSNVEIDFFYRLKEIMNKNFNSNLYYTKELSYENLVGKGNIRHILETNSDFNIDNNTQSHYMLKNSYKKHNIYDYDYRFSLSSEYPISKNRIKGVDFNNPKFIRYKNRISYKLDIGKLDLTIVMGGTSENELKTTYEVELEINKNDYNKTIDFLIFILQIRQNSYYIISSTEKKDILNQYKKLLKQESRPYFIGAQPETLQRDNLHLIEIDYSVTDKADGDRFFMFIDKHKFIYFIDNNINNVIKTNIKSKKFFNCIIDGELMHKEQFKINFYAFDLLMFNGEDIRGNTDYLLDKRLNILHKIIDDIYNTILFNIKIKKYIFNNVFSGSKEIMNNIDTKPYKNDGLIFTPINEPYPISTKWTKLLKWKPAELNTIDFFSIKKTNDKIDDIWELYVQGPDKSLILFNCDSFNDKVTSTTSFNDSFVDPTTNEYYKSNTVIEYKWDTFLLKWIPLRTRWDKTANPRKHGNFWTVACNIWDNINNPITLEMITQNTTEIITEITPDTIQTTETMSSKVMSFETSFKNKSCKKGKGGWMINELVKICSDLNIILTSKEIKSKELICKKINNYFKSKTTAETTTAETTENSSKSSFYSKHCKKGKGGWTIDELVKICKKLNIKLTSKDIKKEVLCEKINKFYK